LPEIIFLGFFTELLEALFLAVDVKDSLEGRIFYLCRGKVVLSVP
jgi:hypothetical protein